MSKRLLFLFSVFIIILLVGCSNDKEVLKQEEYKNDLQDLVLDIVSSASNSENIINTYLKVWASTIDGNVGINELTNIFNIDDLTIRKINGQQNNKLIKNKDKNNEYIIIRDGDIDNAINVTYIILNYLDKITPIEEERIEISSQIKKLNSPPDQFNIPYEIAFEMYSLYEDFVDLAISPSGSLLSYRENSEEISSQLIKKYKEFEARMPNE